jgi:hypothetical protein
VQSCDGKYFQRPALLGAEVTFFRQLGGETVIESPTVMEATRGKGAPPVKAGQVDVWLGRRVGS